MLATFGVGFKIPIKPLIIQILVALLFSCLTIPIASSKKEYTDSMKITVDGFTPIVQEWEEIGVSPWINSNDNDTSVIHFNYTLTPSVKKHYYWSFENLERNDIGKVISIINVTCTYWRRAEIIGDTFHVKMYWWNGSDYELNGVWATADEDWGSNTIDISSTLDTPQIVENVKLKLTNWGSPSSDYKGRISYVYLSVWFTYTKAPTFIDKYFGLGLFIGGIIMMIYAPSWVAWKVKKSGVTPDTVERLGYAMLIFLVGFGLFLSFIYGSGA